MTNYETPDLFQTEESSPEDSPAKTSPWLAVVQAWMGHDPACSGTSCGCWMKHAPVGASSKTSLASCHLNADGIWESSSARWENSGMGSPIECWTLSTSEFPNGDGASSSSLADILETDAPQLHKYYLSQKAAAGILRRAHRRGKRLPEPLAAALEAVSGHQTPNE